MNTQTQTGVIETVKDKGVDAIKGTGDIAKTTMDTAAKVVEVTVKDAAKVGNEVGAAATGLVAGAIKDVKEVGVGAEKAVAAVADGAIKAVGDVASTTVSTVHNIGTKPIPVHKDAPAVAMAK